MGRVWLGHDDMLLRKVAVKEIVTPPGVSEAGRAKMRERALREARSIARLDHVNVVRIFDIVIADGDPWIVMEYIPSQSLRSLLERDGRISPQQGAVIGLAVLKALGAAHRAGVVHRDVKPDNILLGRDERIVLTDFGLATVDSEDPRLTHSGAFVGTPSYLAPERLLGGRAEPISDLWSLGVTLYTAVEGRTPYQRDSSLAILTAVLMEPPPATRHAGPLTPVIEGLMRKDPAQRIDAATAGELLRTTLDLPGPMTATLPGNAAAGHARRVPGRRSPGAPAASSSVAGPPRPDVSARAAGRHHLGLPSRGFGAKIAAAAATLSLLLGVGWIIDAAAGEADCTQGRTLRVAAAPDIAPAIRAVVESGGEASDRLRCVEVTAAEPTAVARVIAAEGNANLPGLGPPSAGSTRPDAWVPDASTWLTRLRAVSEDLVPAAGRSVASSPVVVAVPQKLADRFGRPNAAMPLLDLVQALTASDGVQAGTVDPAHDAAALSALMGVDTLANGTSPKARTAAIAGIRALAAHAESERADLLARFPGANDPSALAAGLAAAPLTEQAVIKYNASKPRVPLVPLFVDPAPAAMDYPFVVLPRQRPAITQLTDRLLTRFSSPDFHRALADQGLRNPLPAGRGRRPDADQIDRALGAWSLVTKPGRTLTVIDVSGSMRTPVPTADGKTRQQITVAAMAAGLDLVGDDWSVGLWTFSTNLNGTKPFHEIAPIRLLSDHRRSLNRALGTVKPTRGQTGLYDTILAAYKEMQDDWDPSRSNAIVLLTGGKNVNPGGLSFDSLLAELRRIADPRRKVQLIAVGIGEASRAELTAITDVTGGGTFLADDPAQVAGIFLQALALRSGPNN